MPQTEHISFAGPLSVMAPITLGEMDAIRLMNRIDTKYVTDERTLTALLTDALQAGYSVLETDGARISAYDSVYFDTPQLQMYYDHRNRKLTRQKVRTRRYVLSGLTFLEIKRKNNKGRTKKKRIAIAENLFNDFRGDAGAAAFLAEKSAFTAEGLTPSIETVFSRITLVNPAKTERLTIDTRLSFKNLRTGGEVSLGPAVIIELKQDGRCDSPMNAILLRRRVKPLRVSKYCVAETLTDPGVRPGRFKLKVRKIEKAIQQKITVI